MSLKKLLLLFLTALSTAPVVSQNRFVIFFTDKNNSPYSISAPQAFLSQRAIQRRTNQNIPVTTLDLPVNDAYANGVAATGVQILARSKWFNSVTIYTSDTTLLNTIQQLPYVASFTAAERPGTVNLPGKFREEMSLREPVSGAQQRVLTNFNYGISYPQVHMMNGDMMHVNGYTGTGMQIAVIDAGFDNANIMEANDSVFSSGRILATWDFVNGETNVFNDFSTHGSMVLSCMAGQIPGQLIGTAPDASFYLLRSEDALSEYIIEEYNWASAAEYADSAGADIINSSLGYTVFNNPAQDHTYSDLDGNTTPVTIAADIAASRGMVVCNSAGNEGNNPNWLHISAPADADSILAVGAVSDSAIYASFSGKGPSFDGRVKPDVACVGKGTIVGDPWTLMGAFPGNGTSFASPLMAGMVATLWQCHPNATNMQIIQAIKQSASQYLNPDSLLGYGIPDIPLACLILGGIDPGIETSTDYLQISGGNPFDGTLQFSLYSAQYQKIQISLYNLLGQPVYRSNAEVNGISVNNFEISTPLAKGIYILNVTTEKRSFSEKVIRQ